jgi:hypothetical protein
MARMRQADPGAEIETAGSASGDPCATLDYPAGEEGDAAHAARCTQTGPGLWMLTTRDGSWAGFARRAGRGDDHAHRPRTKPPSGMRVCWCVRGRSGPGLAAQHQWHS